MVDSHIRLPTASVYGQSPFGSPSSLTLNSTPGVAGMLADECTPQRCSMLSTKAFCVISNVPNFQLLFKIFDLTAGWNVFSFFITYVHVQMWLCPCFQRCRFELPHFIHFRVAPIIENIDRQVWRIYSKWPFVSSRCMILRRVRRNPSSISAPPSSGVPVRCVSRGYKKLKLHALSFAYQCLPICKTHTRFGFTPSKKFHRELDGLLPGRTLQRPVRIVRQPPRNIDSTF